MVENPWKNGGNIGKHRGTWWKTMEKINGGHIGKKKYRNNGKMVENQWKMMEQIGKHGE